MSEPLRTSNFTGHEESWRLRLLRTQDRAGRPLGAGVLLPGGLVLTCAHVVLSRPDSSGIRTPLEEVYVDVPRAPAREAEEPLRARLLREYLVPPTGQFGGDLALLKLDHEPAVPHAVLHRQIPARGDMVHFTGYPEDLPGGEHLDARLMGRGGPAPTPEWVQLDALNAPYVVRRGYSGCAVVHSRTRRVIGIVAHQFGTPQVRVRRDHAYMIPTETVLKHLPLERLGLTVTGQPAVSHDVAVAHHRTASGRVPGLHQRLTRWLDGTPDTDPVEPVFAGEGEHDLLHTVRSVLTLADREQSPPEGASAPGSDSGTPGVPGGPQVGSIDIAVDATNRTAAELARHAADRIGLDPVPDGPGGPGGGPNGHGTRAVPHSRDSPETPETPVAPVAPDADGGGPDGGLLTRIAEESPPLIAAFLSVDRSASTDDEIVRLLTALLARGQSRLLLVFSDPRSPLLARVRDELLGVDWSVRRTERLGTRVSRLAETEQRLRQLSGRRPAAQAPRLRRTLEQIGPEGPLHGSVDQVRALFRCAVDIEAALLEAEAVEQELAGPAGPREFVVGPPGDGLTDLPAVAVRDPDALVTEQAGDRLAGGVMLHQQYEVVGPIGQGSHGKVYLARDLLLENRPVALKGILDPGDPAAVLQAHQERLRLVSLNHPSVIRVVNYARHERTSSEFIVMEFADGASLSWVASRIARHVEPFAGPRVREFVVAYGLLILEAFHYLHDKEKLVYGDLSLTNVLHCGTGIKLIDVAGVREPGAPGPVTHRPPESMNTGGRMTTAGDLYTVGAVLGELVAKDPSPPSDLGTESLQRALSRATATDPKRRYATAQEMAVQLRGVLRELRSLRLDEETFEPSPLFDSAAIALDGRLGRPPPLERWGADGTADRLGAHVPEPSEAAVALPVPKPDELDPNWKELQRTSHDDPAGLLQLSNEWLPSPELHLLRCRLQLELAGTRRHSRDEALVTAAVELERAARLLGERAGYDWRLDWHQGLTQLAHGRLHRALNCFDTVYAAIPGEYAPKLALGYCHEKLADEWRAGGRADAPEAPAAREAHEQQAMLFYDAVWRRNHALGAAAFGLARIHLARHSPDRALASLDGVPPDSRHRTAARTAMVRIHAGAPTVASAIRAQAALHRLTGQEGLTDRQAQERLTAELREQLLELVRSSGSDRVLTELRAALPKTIPLPATERELREQLSASYRQLAKQVLRKDLPHGAALAEALLDNAYSTRPLGLRHTRPRVGRRAWLRRLSPGGRA
ncbi:tetratricopeptide repeat protein [Streptomyces sp. NPDC006283]|uniref:tetratricopeptide repeat protein n=1 Tax=Streptomyces sp. NPDC006283 TaxID=3156741 RepID=UPI0033A92A80